MTAKSKPRPAAPAKAPAPEPVDESTKPKKKSRARHFAEATGRSLSAPATIGDLVDFHEYHGSPPHKDDESEEASA